MTASFPSARIPQLRRSVTRGDIQRNSSSDLIRRLEEGMETRSNDVGVKVRTDRQVTHAVTRDRRRKKSVEVPPGSCQPAAGP